MAAVAAQRQRGSGNGLVGAEGVALDAGNLGQSALRASIGSGPLRKQENFPKCYL